MPPWHMSTMLGLEVVKIGVREDSRFEPHTALGTQQTTSGVEIR